MTLRSFSSLYATAILVLSFSSGAVAGLSTEDLERVQVKTVAQYTNLAPMKSCFRGEEETPARPTCAFSHSFTVKYFREDNEQDRAERETLRVVFIAGTVRRAKTPELIMPEQGKMNYVMDASGNFYIFNEKIREEIRHSSIFAGGKVASAGDLKLENGKIIKIDAHSGHYEMTEEILANVFDFLKKNGITL